MRLLIVALLLFSCSVAAAQDIDPGHAQRVREFVAASNRQDVEAMLAATEPDFRWIQVVGDITTTEVIGHSDLRSWLESYFHATPDAHAELGPVTVNGAFASVVETSRWSHADGSREAQSATSVYQFAPSGRIQFVWYFMAQPVEPTP